MGTTTATNTTDPLAQLAEQLHTLQAENERLKQERANDWRARCDVHDLTDKLAKRDREIDELRREVSSLRRDNYHWREAVRYEQMLKKPGRRVRHVPIYNSVARRKFDAAPWVNRERVFIRHWRNENTRVQGLNGGHGVLESILSENSNQYAADITQRDATVAATVIQWLGTNCGQCFLFEVQRTIDRKKASRKSA